MAGALTAAIAAAFSGGAVAATDPYYEYTTLLLPGNGTNGAQNNTFLDASTNNFTITRNGNTTQGTFSPFSQTGWGNYFNGSSYLQVASNSNLALGSGDFTVEFWLYSSGASGSDFVIDTRGTGSDAGFAIVFGPPSYILQVYRNGSYILTSSQAFAADVWNHVAFVRNGATSYLYLNGTQVASASDSNTYIQSGAKIGVGWNVNDYLTGYVSNLRIVKGTAVYTSAFTPPTSPLTAITNTTLLTCQSNRFVDNSASPLAITVTGSPSIQAFSPFNPTSSWSAVTNGGSGYFDGTGDYLSTPSNAAFGMDAGDFTYEAWVYVNEIVPSGVSRGLFDGRISGATGCGIYTSASGGYTSKLAYATNSAVVGSSANVIVPYMWTHVAVTRSATTVRGFLNGVLEFTVTDSRTFSSSASTYIGSDSSVNYFNGYIANARIVKGTAVYTAAFTPPTAPLTDITNTSLLLNFTNAGIYDATSKNDLETVADAQISNTTAKWGSTSIKFDGTGDWLLIPDQPPQRIGTGNFTVEMWVYRNSSGTYGLAGKGTGTTGWLVSLNSSNQVVFTYGSSTITSSGTVSATTWTHIAVVREGTSTNQTKIYINGTNDGTGTVSTDFNQTNSMYIGADRTGGSAANAYVQDVRITNYARYTANFTAPTAAFPTL